ncbi:SDR family oxidoreductase [Frankia sp. AgKG'84/4]
MPRRAGDRRGPRARRGGRRRSRRGSLAADLTRRVGDRERRLPRVDGRHPALQLESARIYDLADTGEFAGHAYLRRLLRPEGSAAAVAFLCSPAAGARTGSVLAVDRGFTG